MRRHLLKVPSERDMTSDGALDIRGGRPLVKTYDDRYHGACQPTSSAGTACCAHREREASFDAAMRLQSPWINKLADGLSIRELQTVHLVIMALRKRLESNDDERLTLVGLRAAVR